MEGKTQRIPVDSQSCSGRALIRPLATRSNWTHRLGWNRPSDLKKKLESVAASEGRSVAQICEVFLRSGLSAALAPPTIPLENLPAPLLVGVGV